MRAGPPTAAVPAETTSFGAKDANAEPAKASDATAAQPKSASLKVFFIWFPPCY